MDKEMPTFIDTMIEAKPKSSGCVISRKIRFLDTILPAKLEVIVEQCQEFPEARHEGILIEVAIIY